MQELQPRTPSSGANSYIHVWKHTCTDSQIAIRCKQEQANHQRCSHPQYRPGYMVWLSITNQHLKLPTNLSPWHISSFKILCQVPVTATCHVLHFSIHPLLLAQTCPLHPRYQQHRCHTSTTIGHRWFSHLPTLYHTGLSEEEAVTLLGGLGGVWTRWKNLRGFPWGPWSLSCHRIPPSPPRSTSF